MSTVGRFPQALTFYDVVLDYILLDAFEDLAAPPSSVLAVVRNRWLSDGFKESVSYLSGPRIIMNLIEPSLAAMPTVQVAKLLILPKVILAV